MKSEIWHWDIKTNIVFILILITAIFSYPKPAYSQDWRSALQAERAQNAQRIDEIEELASAVYSDYQSVQNQIQRHNDNRCLYPDGHSEVCKWYDDEARVLDGKSARLLAQLQAFKDEEDKLIVRNKEIDRRLHCAQLPISCRNNSDCECSECCGSWDSGRGVGRCQPSCN